MALFTVSIRATSYTEGALTGARLGPTMGEVERSGTGAECEVIVMRALPVRRRYFLVGTLVSMSIIVAMLALGGCASSSGAHPRSRQALP